MRRVTPFEIECLQLSLLFFFCLNRGFCTSSFPLPGQLRSSDRIDHDPVLWHRGVHVRLPTATGGHDAAGGGEGAGADRSDRREWATKHIGSKAGLLCVLPATGY